MCACKYLIGHRSTLPDDKALFCEKKYWASFNFFAGALSLCTLCCVNVVASFKWMRGLCFFTQGWSPSEWVYFKPSACWIVWQQLKPFFWQWTLGLASAIFVTFPDNPVQWLAQCAEVQNLNTVLLSLFMWTTHCNTMNAFEEKLFALRATKMQSSWREVSEAVGHSPLCLVSQNSYKNIYLLKMVSDIAHSSSFEAYWGL